MPNKKAYILCRGKGTYSFATICYKYLLSASSYVGLDCTVGYRDRDAIISTFRRDKTVVL